MGMEAETIFKSLSFSADTDKDKFDVVLQKFEEHFIPKRNVIYERAKFHQRMQHEGETIEVYVRALFDLSQYCEFRDNRDDFIRDKLVIGLRDRSLSEKLQLTKDLTLDVAIDMSRHHELIKSQNVSQPNVAAVSKGQTHKYSRQNTRPQRRQQQQQPRHNSTQQQRQQSRICGYCGFDTDRSHAKRNECPAKNAQCQFCGKIGHFERACRQKKRVHGVSQQPDSPPEDTTGGVGGVTQDVFFLGIDHAGSRRTDWRCEATSRHEQGACQDSR